MSYTRSHRSRGRGIFAAAGLGSDNPYRTHGLFGLGSDNPYRTHGLFGLFGLGQTKTAGPTTEPDHTASDWATALSTGGSLVSSIIGAATGQQSATPSATPATPALDVTTATAPPVSPTPDWYWPVMIGVGVAVLGGIAYMSYSVKGPLKANRGRRGRRVRRISRNKISKKERSKLPKSAFVFPARRAWPLDSPKRAYDAMKALRLGRYGSASDYMKVANAIQRKYPKVWAQHKSMLSFPKAKAAKAKARVSRAKTVAAKRTSRKAA